MGITVGAAVGKDVGNELVGLAVGGTVGLNNWSVVPKEDNKLTVQFLSNENNRTVRVS